MVDVVGNAILGVRDGVVKAVIDIFEGLLDMIVALTTDPLGFFKGIGNAVLHPVDTFNYMWGAVETAWERDVVKGNARSRGEFFSYALVSIVGLKGIDKAGKVGKVNKLGKGGAKVDGNNSLSSAAKVHTSNSLVPIPFNVFQTVKLKELVKHNVVSAFSKGSQWTKDFFKNDLVQKALKQGVVAISNAKTLSKIRNVVNPAAFNSFFKNTFNDVIKGPLAKTKVAIDQQLMKVVEGIGKVEVPTRIRIESLDFSIGMSFPVVDLGITTMKDVVQKISVNKSEKASMGNSIENTLKADYSDIRAYRNIDIEKIPIKYRADPRLVSEMNYKGKYKSGTNAAGWERSASKHFNELLDNHPDFFSEANIERIENGLVPIVDDNFIKHFPQYKDCEGDKLIHHHIGGGGQAATVPQSLHKGFGGIHNFEKEHNIRGNDPLTEIGRVFTSEKNP